jgi:transketolase
MNSSRLTENSDFDILEKLANRIRIHALRMTSLGSSSHIGSIFSVADILAVLYGKILNINPKEPKWVGRDRFILSKGHAGAGVYAALAEKGFFPLERLHDHYQNGSELSGHISHKGIPGVELSTGSLGHGLPVAAGMALAGKLNHKSHRVIALLSDGECDEGTTWEAAMFASHNKLNNLVAIIDRNRLQSMESTEETLALEPFADKWHAFGWHTTEVDAHNYEELIFALTAKNYISYSQPLVIIANSIKGKGVSFMENSVLWHYRSPQGDDFENALCELNGMKKI